MGGGIAMGLDSVELVIAIEEEFGVDIPDKEAETMVTVGDVFEWLKVRIASSEPIACLTQKVFYKLRRALIENYGLERQVIEPGTRLTDLLPLNIVEDGWPFLQMFIELKTPPFAVANEFLGLRLSDKTLTMRQLVESLIKVNGRALAPQRESEEEIWNRLVRVFVRQLNVNPDEVRPEASITRDLGCD
jgi:acyl carrier protein